MSQESNCPECGVALPSPGAPCPDCGGLFDGLREVAVEPMRQEALVAFGLLQSAGLHPILAYRDDSDRPHPIDPDEPLTRGAGLMVPLTTSFGVFVPEAEAEDSRGVLDDARSALKDEAVE
jgi:hypothetical protein